MLVLGASGHGLVRVHGASILVSRIQLLLHVRVASVSSPGLAASPGWIVSPSLGVSHYFKWSGCDPFVPIGGALDDPGDPRDPV